MRVGYDSAPLAMNRAGERRYAQALLGALRGLPGLTLVELTLSRRRPRSFRQRVAYQALAESVYYPLLIGRRAARLGVDLIHHPRHLVPPELGRRVPSVVTVHDVLPLTEPEHYSQLIVRRYRLLTRTAIRSAGIVMTGSRHAAGEIAEALGVEPDRLRVTPYGVEERFRPLPADPDWLRRRFGIPGPYALCVATLEPRKNLHGAVAAFERVQEDHPDHSLVLVGGRGWKPEAFEAAVGATTARIVPTGYVADEELVRLYSGAACFLFPSLAEGFGFPVLEAMACGAPVVSGDRASLPEVVGDAGLLVDPTRVDAIAGGLGRVLGEPALAERLRARGFERARRFSWRRCAELTAEAYRDALS